MVKKPTLEEQIEETKRLIKEATSRRIRDDYKLRLKLLKQFKEEEDRSKKLTKLLEEAEESMKKSFEESVDPVVYKKEINKRKQKIVEEYGTEPTICFFHYLWNAVDYIGEKDLRKNFESLVGQGDEVLVADQGSTDDTKKIAEEYGFKVINVERDPNIPFAQSKMKNILIKETKCNFMVECDVHVEYPKNITNIMRKWIRNNDITKKMLVLRGLWVNERGKLVREYSFGPAAVFYTPYLIEARGYDERCYMSYGGTHYGVSLMLDVYMLEFDNQHLDTMIHKHHIPAKTKAMEDLFGVSNVGESHIKSLIHGKKLANELRIDFDKGVENVKNSYW